MMGPSCQEDKDFGPSLGKTGPSIMLELLADRGDKGENIGWGVIGCDNGFTLP